MRSNNWVHVVFPHATISETALRLLSEAMVSKPGGKNSKFEKAFVKKEVGSEALLMPLAIVTYAAIVACFREVREEELSALIELLRKRPC